MVNFKHKEKKLRDAFNITEAEMQVCKEIIMSKISTDTQHTITWLVQRTWLDERLSDNARCFMIFHLGQADGMANVIFGGYRAP